jgi:GNAT superfamily N-acetyltransferase
VWPRTTTTPDAATARGARGARAQAARAAPFERAATRVVPLDWGSAIFNDDFPRWADLNTLRVEVPVADLSAERLDAVVERHQGGLDQRRVEVFDEATAQRVAPGMEALGYEPGRSVLMGWDGGEPPLAPAVEEVPYRAVEHLRAEWLRGDPWAPDLEQVLAADRHTFATTPTRAFAVVEQGLPRAYGLLVDLGEVALVEDVYASPAVRGRGLAASIIHRLVFESRAGGHEDTVLATPAAGAARPLYERLGFTRLGVVHRFLRRPR